MFAQIAKAAPTPVLMFAVALLTMDRLMAQTVDCNIPSSPTETTICNSKSLTLMDGELNRAYSAARARWTASMSKSVKIQYEDWLRERDACGSNQKCLMHQIVREIRALDANRPRNPTWILDVQ